jgi:hypothetical protein
MREGDKHLDIFGERIAAFDDGRASFRGFCRYLSAGGEAENAHWMRQTRLTNLMDRLDIIGHVETLETDMRRIVQRIGRDEVHFGAMERAGPAPTGASTRLAEYYDDECRQLVASVYAADFQAFGYECGYVAAQA